MSQGNQFHQYGYDHYLKAPKKQRPVPQSRFAGFSSALKGQSKSPVFATCALLGAAALFVGAVYIAYPAEQEQKAVPIVKADLGAIKVKPSEPGGLKVPNTDSTLLARAGQPSIQADAQQIKNLLERQKQIMSSKEEAIAKAMESSAAASEFYEKPEDDAMVGALPRDAEDQAVDVFADAQSVKTITVKDVDGSDAVSSSSEVSKPETEVTQSASSSFEIKEPSANNILQKIGSVSSEVAETNANEGVGEFEMKVASAAAQGKPAAPVVAKVPGKVNAPGQAPETIEYVRNVLQEKEAAASGASSIEPAAGLNAAPEITAGNYFVQLASITDPARAGGEWAKMQAKYGVLKSSKFRVQEASLASGTFYRIQAGPMSKGSATEICDSLKKSGKPGGCLVVK